MSTNIITSAQVVAEVRKLAEERPDFVYRSQPGSSPDCSYLGAYMPEEGEPYTGEGCIVGQALTRLGVDETALRTVEGQGARGALVDLGIQCSQVDLDWLSEVQSYQDDHRSWRQSVLWASDETPLGVTL